MTQRLTDNQYHSISTPQNHRAGAPAPTDRLSGVCQACRRPVVVESPGTSSYATLDCPECQQEVRLERVYGVQVDMNCDPRCQFATSSLCSCSCGGANHCKGWVPPVEVEVTAGSIERLAAWKVERDSRLASYRSHREAIDNRTKANREAKKAAELAAYELYLADERVVRFLAEAEQWGYDVSWGDDFLRSLWEQHNSGKTLSDRQLDAAIRALDRKATRAARKVEEEANATPAPSGKVAVQGVVLSEDWREGYMGAKVHKMLVKVTREDGRWYKVWSTVPRSISANVERGRDVRFEATLVPSRDDPFFAYASRPSKASVIVTGVESLVNEDREEVRAN